MRVPSHEAAGCSSPTTQLLDPMGLYLGPGGTSSAGATPAWDGQAWVITSTYSTGVGTSAIAVRRVAADGVLLDAAPFVISEQPGAGAAGRARRRR
ncbi:MAG: hypothetical protein JNK82_04500 [Myxococcaceae bacterium]|nr:hypothetical protein [Myxococcaceae bacterium]